MPLGALDSTLFADMFGTEIMRAVFDDRAFLARCVEVEAALARAEARLGMIPAAAAETISRVAMELVGGAVALDVMRLKRETETVGYPILPLVRQIAALCGEAGRWVHWGATTQDIMDTALVLQIRAGLAVLEQDLATVRSYLCDLARRRWPGAPTCNTPCRSPLATRPRSGWRRSIATHCASRSCGRASCSPNLAAPPAPSPPSTPAAPGGLRSAPSWPGNWSLATRRSPGMRPGTALPKPCRCWPSWVAALARSRLTSC